MEVFNKYTAIIICSLSALLFSCSHAQQQQPESTSRLQETCLSIQNDYVSLIESGKYRFANESQENAVTEIDFDKLTSYEEYLTAAQAIVQQRNPKADMPCPIPTETYKQLAKLNQWSETPKTSQLVMPYELTQNNNDKAILLIHGLTDSPFSFHDLSQYFYKQGFTVRTLLLPGHSTAPSDLIDIDFEDWQAAGDFAIEQTLKDFEQVYLGGLSTGGAVIFDYLMQQQSVDESLKGLFMWSPASKAKNDMAWLAGYVDLIPFVDWIDKDADIDFAKYESFPFNAAAQVDDIMKRVVGSKSASGRQLHDIPIFVVASEHDQTIDTPHTLQLVEEWQLASPPEQMQKSTLIYYGNKEKLPKELTNVLKLVVPECTPQSLCSDIFDVSHISTTHSPNNPHYGVNGKYRNCGHYLKRIEEYQTCKQSKQVIKGEVTAKNLSRDTPMQRLTYNPYYPEMLTEMTLFLEATH